MMKLQTIVIGLFCLLKTIHSERFGGTCVEPSVASQGAGTDLVISFSFDPTGLADITGVESFQASEDPTFVTAVTDAGCFSDTLLADGTYKISLDVDVDGALPCGIQQQVNLNQYKFAISPVGLDTVYVLTCDVTNFDVNAEVSVINFASGHIVASTVGTFTGDVDFAILHPHDIVIPAASQVEIATPVKLRLTFTSNSPIMSLHVTSLIMGNNAAFNDKVQPIITAGCNNNNAGTTSKSVGLFSRVGTTPPVILDTNVFRAYRFAAGSANYADVFFRVTFETCPTGTDCNVCSARKRRSEEETGLEEHRDLHVRVVSPRKTDGKGRTECKTIVAYWAPHALLLLTILIEGAVVAHILRRKSKYV